uniref:Predicted protein n=1 Tax=Hordeum vulgare subsp. vulgare TaxID=112509 RepID=F2EBM2_HORVV|nr:predicted protein [Hordeum vulgare subsp. vulgare]
MEHRDGSPREPVGEEEGAHSRALLLLCLSIAVGGGVSRSRVGCWDRAPSRGARRGDGDDEAELLPSADRPATGRGPHDRIWGHRCVPRMPEMTTGFVVPYCGRGMRGLRPEY